MNVAASSLVDAEFPDLVAQLIAEQDVDPLGVILEVTETTMMTDSARSRLVLSALDEIGVGLSIDDFGTGYSSLSYLQRLPVDELKIDRSFVAGMLTDPQDEVIVRSTVDLGHNLGLLVVAEGVESLPVLERLCSIGCDEAQGYAISEPVAADQLVEWVRRANAADRASGPTGWVGSVI